MKSLILAATLAGLAAAAPLSAQTRSTSGRVIPTNRTSRQDCTYNQNPNSVSSIVFGRSGTNTANNDCQYNGGNRVDGQWYSVGQDGNGNAIYERRVRDNNGNIIVQRARRDSFGNMSIISSRNIGNSGSYGNDGRSNNGRYNNGRYSNRNNGSWNANRRRDRDHDGDDDDQGNDGRGSWKKGSYDRNAGGSHGKAEHKNHGRGKDKKDRD
jgi:hypothetical protein